MERPEEEEESVRIIEYKNTNSTMAKIPARFHNIKYNYENKQPYKLHKMPYKLLYKGKIWETVSTRFKIKMHTRKQITRQKIIKTKIL